MKKNEMNFAKETDRLINNYSWNEKELALLNGEGFAPIYEKFYSMNDDLFDTVTEKFTDWLLGIIKKSDLNYWLKKANVTVEELNIYMTW